MKISEMVRSGTQKVQGDAKSAIPFAESLETTGRSLKSHLAAGDTKKGWKALGILFGNLKVLVSYLDGGTAEPKEVPLLAKLQSLVANRK